MVGSPVLFKAALKATGAAKAAFSPPGLTAPDEHLKRLYGPEEKERT